MNRHHSANLPPTDAVLPSETLLTASDPPGSPPCPAGAGATAAVDLRRRAWLFAGLATATGPLAAATTDAPSADEVKAAYVHKLPGYVEWPSTAFDDAGAPFVVGVLGAQGVADALTRLAGGRPVQGRPMVVRPMKRRLSDEPVHILFVGSDAWPDLRGELAAATAAHPVLVVTEVEGALQRGSMLNFVLVDGRVRFEVAPGAAERHGLKVSSRLLAVAQRVLGVAP
jgi:hypothetical protein